VLDFQSAIRHGATMVAMRVVPLSDVPINSLDAALTAEEKYWREELFWDYRPAIGLIRKYVKAQSLPGFALLTPERLVAGYCYYVVDASAEESGLPTTGYIGNVFMLPQWASPEGYGLLLRRAVEALKSQKMVDRIESQVFNFNCDLAPLFHERGFEALSRHFMVLDLEEASGEHPAKPEGCRIVPWSRNYFFAAADVIHDSYFGSPDRLLCRDYQTLDGCRRFLRNLIDNPGCGIFTAETSCLAVTSAGEVAAVLITSQISEKTGMIPQISVRRRFQGKGLGSGLLNSYFEKARQVGLQRIALSVSEANRGAYNLYCRMGFYSRKRFHAFIWARSPVEKTVKVERSSTLLHDC
jgi:ribosomal protein S18 acetylase RimI-like enzyme